MTFAINGGLVSEIRLFAETWADYLILEAAMGMYEFLICFLKQFR
jgi:hypothetical protein